MTGEADLLSSKFFWKNIYFSGLFRENIYFSYPWFREKQSFFLKIQGKIFFKMFINPGKLFRLLGESLIYLVMSSVKSLCGKMCVLGRCLFLPYFFWIKLRYRFSLASKKELSEGEGVRSKLISRIFLLFGIRERRSPGNEVA